MGQEKSSAAASSRVHHQLRAKGQKSSKTHPLQGGIHTRGYLPHVKCEGADYFVTFRLADSLPKHVLLELEAERAKRLDAGQSPEVVIQNRRDMEFIIQRDFRRQLERYLDRGIGACHLRNPSVADLVAGALRFFDGQRYQLREWVVMPNHVHVVLWPIPNHTVSSILKSWKQFTSAQSKHLLGLPQGRFWQPESYDHWIRDDEELARICRYVRLNPVTAGLCQRPEQWRWSSAWQKPDLTDC